MITLSDILSINGYVIGSFLLGYGLSYLLYVIRRGLWHSTR